MVYVAVLAAQVLASYATSHKVYVLSCAGTADAVLDARLAMGEKLRRLPLGFYQRHDAGDIDSVLLRDYETVENYGAEVLSQAGMIAAKTTLSAVVLAFSTGAWPWPPSRWCPARCPSSGRGSTRWRRAAGA
ncbi:MAG: hypothetical protein ACLR3C_11405 [Eggerthella lenta]